MYHQTKRNTNTKKHTIMSTAKTKTVYRDGAIITTERQGGRYIATIRYTQSGDRETVKATFSKLLTAKVDVAIKNHYSAVIQSLAQTAREINANARKK